jgi:hypothetical protein
MKKPTTTSIPKPKPGAKGKPIDEIEDFGETTFARAFKAVKDTIQEVSPADKDKPKKKAQR